MVVIKNTLLNWAEKQLNYTILKKNFAFLRKIRTRYC